jgi:tetratricopeptide (TPR) repeat protein
LSTQTPLVPISRLLEAGYNHYLKSEIHLAEMMFRQILGQDPEHLEALKVLSWMAHQKDKKPGSNPWAEQMSRVHNERYDKMNTLGVQNMDAGFIPESITTLHWAVQGFPNSFIPYGNLANALVKAKKPFLAEQYYNFALLLKEDSPEVHFNLANMLDAENRPDDARIHYERAVALAPQLLQAWHNLGTVYSKLNQPQNALKAYQQVLHPQPDSVATLNNYANLLYHLGFFPEAEAHFLKANQLQPDLLQVVINFATLRLSQGRYKEGLALYEHRLKQPDYQYGKLAIPPWEGLHQRLTGKTILVLWEQGLGDNLAMSRYIQRLEAQGADIIWQVRPETNRLFGWIDGISPLLTNQATSETVKSIDYYCYAMSLPYLFETRSDTLPAVEHLTLPKGQKVRGKRALHSSKKNIGLCWSTLSQSLTAGYRSIALKDLEPLLTCSPDINWVVLQPVKPDADKALLERYEIRADIDDTWDLADTALLISKLDSIVTIDTVIPHLSAMLAIPTMVLLPRVPDWRWPQWYPQHTILQQGQLGQWQPVIDSLLSQFSAVGPVPALT